MFLAAPVKREIKPKIKKNLPVRLIIKNLNIDLPIFSAKVIGQNWQTTSLGVSWLDISPHPGEIGNSIMYGHNWTNLLGNLIYAKPGQEIEIKYSDGKSKIFFIDKTAEVSPNDVSVLAQTKDQRVTIYTCIGFLDEKRLVIVAKM